MDAAEHDADVKLYKASGELLGELQAKLPLLLSNSDHPKHGIRKWVIVSKVEELTSLLDRFQEWPQLLDPYLARHLKLLVEAFLTYCTSFALVYLQEHHHRRHAEIIPLPRAIARVLYTLCKVRGQKVIVHLLNNEPKYIEPLLFCFRLWGYQRMSHEGHKVELMTWEERYIMLLWLSHLMLAPFELSSISGLAANHSRLQPAKFTANLPEVAQNLLHLGLDHLQVPSKDREAAGILLIRLALRGDMQALNLPTTIVDWALDSLTGNASQSDTTEYHYIGLLALLSGMVSSGSNSETLPFIGQLVITVHKLADVENGQYEAIWDQAPARKLMIKIIRAAMIHMVTISTNDARMGASMDVDSLLEASIQLLLDYLADKDTPVRQAASKALSLLCLKLDNAMAAEVIEAVLGCLNENILLENLSTRELVSITDVAIDNVSKYRKNINAVDSLKWHGAMLTLGHLLFRRSPPLEQLPTVIEALLIGLEFEQRSNVGTSIGVSVRDAACFGIWSLARNYSTIELNSLSITASILPLGYDKSGTESISIIQVVAMRLVNSACLDPSGNIRRGSSAALQELIGRHPDVVSEGIRLVQVVDYHAVARRSRAIEDVAITTSKLDNSYQSALHQALLQWRGARATDADSRRFAAKAVGTLFSFLPPQDTQGFLEHIFTQIVTLSSSNAGSNAAARHGLLLSLASILDVISSKATLSLLQIAVIASKRVLHNIHLVTGSVAGRLSADLEIVFEAIANFLTAYLKLATRLSTSNSEQLKPLLDEDLIQNILPVLDRCTISSEKDFVTTAAAQANVSLLHLLPNKVNLLSTWLDPKSQRKTDYTCRGRIATFAAVIIFLSEEDGRGHQGLIGDIVTYFCNIIEEDGYNIEVKVNAMHGIAQVLKTATGLLSSQITQFLRVVEVGLSNYTVNQRGDIGSLLRFASIDAAKVLMQRDIDRASILTVQQLVMKLAGERLAKVRLQAWICLRSFTSILSEHDMPVTAANRSLRTLNLEGFDHQADVSSFEYYKALLQFLYVPDLRHHLLLGLISSSAAGTEEISRASTEALMAVVLECDEYGQREIFESMLSFVTSHLDHNAKKEDRELVPAIDFFALLLEQFWFLVQGSSSIDLDAERVWGVVQRIHLPSSTIWRLEALIRLYSAMMTIDECRLLALDRLTRMLLHKWPKIRSLVASTVFFRTNDNSIISTDWRLAAASNKDAVVLLRKNLNVAGVAVGTSAKKSEAAG